ncbi:MAG: FumA C-terminus/TtdB family hydratase beta subunit [Deltaproteobacteria bacterium]|jgi:fumarate hydratase subunit beta|nr:FumA C-terminus/TtdB family hydratase beta subunit [Deltaproteobacteria bacterium]
MAEYELTVPLREEEIRRLRAKDTVYVSGEVLTVRDMAYERILSALDSHEGLPFSLQGKAIWHAGPITRQRGGKWEPVSVGSTTSSRFTGPASRLIEKMGVKMVIGKGFMGPQALEAFQKYGAVYAHTTGGTAAYYASQIPEIQAVHWLDLGMPAAVWVLKVKRLGPLIVAMDSYGKNIFDELQSRVDDSLKRIFADLKIDPQHKYLWWP